MIDPDLSAAVATAKQSAYEIANCALISAALIMSSESGEITSMGRFNSRSRFSFAASRPILLIVK